MENLAVVAVVLVIGEKTMPLLVVGSVALDTVETPFGKRERCLGGSASYFSVASSYFTQSKVVAVVGEDFPKKHIDLLSSKGVNLDSLEVLAEGKTFFWEGKYSGDMNQAETITTELNVFQDFKPRLSQVDSQIPVLFLANIHPSLQETVVKQAGGAKFVAIDTMNFWIQGTPKELSRVLKQVNMLVINDGEVRMLSNVDNIFRAIKKVQQMGPEILVVKRGEYGLIIKYKDYLYIAPAYPLQEVVDPTGAGDTFAGGTMGVLSLLYERQQALSFQDIQLATIFGTVLASFNVEHFSLEGITSLNREQIQERCLSYCRLTGQSWAPDKIDKILNN